MGNISGMIADLGQQARLAVSTLTAVPSSKINDTLKTLEGLLIEKATDILTANKKDVEAASANIDRLTLNEARIKSMATSVADIRGLDDPCYIVLEEWARPNHLVMQKISVPIGVLGIIYEARPNVTIDAAALCLKSRNAVILRAGSDSKHSSTALFNLVREALNKNGLPEGCVCMVTDQDRALVGHMLNAVGLIDVIIPRGGKNLTSLAMTESKVPVFAHLDGNCHIYVHPTAKADLALSVIKNAKLRRTGICGATESLLFDEKIKQVTAKNILSMLLDEDVEVVGDKNAQSIDKRVEPATEQDWSTEYLDKKISVKYVDGVEEAVKHINKYGSHHTESILTEDKASADYFLKNVDSAIVMHNTSTQFADGGEFGFGAEIGIGTGKLHARGPVGLRQLTTFKYIVRGSGQVRA